MTSDEELLATHRTRIQSFVEKKANEKPEPEVPDRFPKAYETFAPVLDRLSDPLQKILKRHLHSLETIFAFVQSRDSKLIGDFEGVGGLTQRGEMHRILQSELLLRSEAPLEFLRRVAEGEALYMETERSDPSEKNIYRMIISMGPELLGHSRLVILAALIFLSRLANQQNADLHWCVLPSKTENDPIWFTELSVNSIKRFLKYASYRNASELDIEQASETWDRIFAETLPSNSSINDWVIRSSTDRKPENPTLNIPNSLAISMSPPIGDVPRICELTLKRKSGRPHKVMLNFPPDVTCISALNRPFRPVIRSTVINPEARTNASKFHGWEPLYHTAISAYLHDKNKD